MKQLSFIFVLLLSVGLLSFISCRKDNADDPENTFVGMDDAKFLAANLVFLDENDNITGYVVGMGLNEADPGEVSIRCDSYEKARDIFLSWLPENATVSESGESLSWNMTDTLGVSQGSAVLKPGGGNGAVAHLELPSKFPAVSSVQFLPSSAMPQNAELDFSDDLDDYYFLNVLNVYAEESHTFGGGAMVVIREYDQETNTSGILLATPNKEYNYWNIWSRDQGAHITRSRSLSALQTVGKEYRKFSKQIDKALTDPFGYANGDHWFLCMDKEWDGLYHMHRYNLKTDKSEKISIFSPTYYEAYVYFFTMEKKGNDYKLVLK